MNSMDRVRAVMTGKKPDRIPIFIPGAAGIHLNGSTASGKLFESSAAKAERFQKKATVPYGFKGEWEKEDSKFQELLHIAKTEADVVRTYVFSALDRKYMYIPPDRYTVNEIRQKKGWLYINYVINTPGGILRQTDTLQKNISSIWVETHPIQTEEDVKKLLSIPIAELLLPDIEDFITQKQQVEKNEIIFIRIDSPISCVARLMPYEQFLIWCVTEQSLIESLLKRAYNHISIVLKQLLQKKVGLFFRIGGSEIVTPPRISPHLFEQLVLKWEKPLVDLIHNYGGKAAMHFHGELKQVITQIISTGCDLLDPVEPPPYGDISLSEARRKAGTGCSLIGNIPYQEMEFGTEQNIDNLVKKAIEETEGERLILAPTDRPITFLSDTLLNNYKQMIRSTHKYSQFIP